MNPPKLSLRGIEADPNDLSHRDLVTEVTAGSKAGTAARLRAIAGEGDRKTARGGRSSNGFRGFQGQAEPAPVRCSCPGGNVVNEATHGVGAIRPRHSLDCSHHIEKEWSTPYCKSRILHWFGN